MGKYGLNFYGIVIAILYFNYYSNIIVTAGLINSKTLTKPDDVEEAKTLAADGQLTSYTNQKTTRLINPDTDNFSIRSRNNKQSNPSTTEAHSNRRPSNRPIEETFDGFPEDFTQGLPPFQFQDENHRGNPSGFTDFPDDERFPSLASKLGGLKPISSPSRPSSTSSATKVSSTNLPTEEIDPQSEVSSGRAKHHGQQPSSALEDESFDPRFSPSQGPTGSSRRPSFSPDEHIRPPHPDFTNEFQDSRRGRRPISGRIRNFEDNFNSEAPLHDDRRFQSPKRPSSFHQDQSDSLHTRPDADESQFQPPAKPSQSVPFPRRPATNADFDHADGQFENFNEAPASTTSGKISEKPVAPTEQFDPEFDFPPSRDAPQSDRTRGRRPISAPINQQQFPDFPNDGQSFLPEKPSSHSQSRPSGSKFRDSDQFDLSQQQQFVPVTHFNDNPFSFSDFRGFRPQISNDDQRGFRNSHSHNQPRAPQNFQNQFDNQGFSEVDPNTFTDPAEDEQKSNFEDFRGQRFNQNEPESSKGSEFEEHRQSPQQQSTSNDQHQPQNQGEDNINHHSSASNLLGSGNFGVLRGGIFADGDHSNSHTQFQPLGRNSQFNGGGYDDFFDGFRDFQPFGGSLHNALSSQSQKMHKIPLGTSHVQQPHQTSQHNIDSMSSKLDNPKNNSTSVQG